ncbi:hypothetical protein JOE11_002342 [Robbsia andropogonis]|uniref:hypothetical protein n=1 Tax=Robbsia andropogonis TaxID=28092 RepID=UPI00209E2971|nr:hypothetical protein [Robbsia andropogonis]MCP1117697.1 hypothetical protein [Robbsia andropogonis]MCP1127163.1 hypothetical protein [Robbsia andropogonis]
MRRSFLAKGDRAGSAVIIEGLPTSTYQGPDGVRVQLATVYMQTWCNACKKGGYISPRGPRHAGKAENGQQRALSGDVNACDCDPQPVYQVVRTISETISDDDLARMSPDIARLSAGESPEDAWHWIGFYLRDAGSCEGLRCAAYFADGSVETSAFDPKNTVSFARPNGSPCTKVEILSDKQSAATASATELLLSAMAPGPMGVA